MFDNMTGAVGFAMHEDRLARATQNLRLREAETVTPQTHRHQIRDTIAGILIGLAAWIAPAVTTLGMSTQATNQ